MQIMMLINSNTKKTGILEIVGLSRGKGRLLGGGGEGGGRRTLGSSSKLHMFKI